MRPQEKIRDRETLDTIKKIIDEGGEKICAIMRHSDRHYPKESAMEPFMGLTETGKDFAMQLGSQLPVNPKPRLFSSYFGRCIETAYLIDKGYIKTHGIFNGHNSQASELAPFYITDIHKAINLVKELGNVDFLRRWFDRGISSDTMLDPETVADKIAGFMIEKIKNLQTEEIALCVSHDWNIYPLKEYKLLLPHEDYGTVGYLESVIIFEKDGKHFITNYQKEPTQLM